MKKTLPVLISLFLVACGGGSSGGGGTQQADSGPDALTATVSRKSFSSSSTCPDGGITIDQGIDANQNGVLDQDEVFETQEVCNGAPGADGLNSLVRVDDEAAGMNCTYGGLKVSVGIDASDDGILDADETSQTNYVCSVVADQTDGYSTLLDLSDEPAGANCTSGGQKISSGLDFNRNAALDTDEIIQIKYVCDGTSPVVYQTLVETSQESAGTNCQNGGVKITAGLDVDQNNILDASEIKTTSYVCNGADGDGNLSLVRIKSEPIGSNCTSGGQAVLTGIDNNGNQYLDSSEVSDTSYICNGQDGADGAGAADTEYISVRMELGDPETINCPDNSGSYSRTDYYTLASGGSGTPYKSCYSEYCYEAIANGSKNHNKQYGESGCNINDRIYYYCDSGYEWNGSQCTSKPAVCGPDNLLLCTDQTACESEGGFWYGGQCQAYCPEGEVETSRGCETPVASSSCAIDQVIEDNQCVDVGYVTVDGNICGEYLDPVRITSGNHFVTCDTNFKNRLLIDAGATLQVDRNWDFIANNGVIVNGNSVSPVTFEMSPNNLDGTWGDIELSGSSWLDYHSGAFYGDFLSYLTVKDYSGDFTVSGLAIENSSLQGSNTIKLQNVLMRNSSVSNDASLYSYGSIILNSTLSPSGYLNTYGGVILSSAINQGGSYARFDYGYGYYNNRLFALAAFSGPITYYCNDGNQVYIQGNESASASSSYGDSCAVSDNGTPITDKYAVYLIGEDNRSTSIGQSIDLEVLVFDKNGIVQPSEVVWKARYDIDGTYYDSGHTWVGRKVSVSLDHKEQYEVYVESVDGQTDLLGPKQIILSVQ